MNRTEVPSRRATAFGAALVGADHLGVAMPGAALVRSTLAGAILVGVALLTAALAGCSDAGRGGGGDLAAPPPPPVPVTAVEVKRMTLAPTLELTGRLVAPPEATAAISARTGGFLDQILVVEGQWVGAGEELMRLDDRAATARLAGAEALVRERQAHLDLLRHGPLPQEREMAHQDVVRLQASLAAAEAREKGLGELLDRGEVSPVDHVSAKSSADAARAELARARARLELLEAGTRPERIAEAEALLAEAEAARDAARLDLEYTRVVSPIPGVVSELAARQSMTVAAGDPLAVVSDLSHLFASVRVPATAAGEVRPGARTTIRVASSPETLSATVRRLTGRADPTSGDRTALLEVDNPGRTLWPGMVCRAAVSLPPIPDALAIPIRALADHDGTTVVTVVREGKAHEAAIETGRRAGDRIQVLRGIEAGDRVTLEGGYGLPDGTPVRLVDPAAKTGGTLDPP